MRDDDYPRMLRRAQMERLAIIGLAIALALLLIGGAFNGWSL